MCVVLVWRIRSLFSVRTHRISFAACALAFAAALFFCRSQELIGMSDGCGQLNVSKFVAKRPLKYKPFHFL